jgi:hypothetical protein
MVVFFQFENSGPEDFDAHVNANRSGAGIQTLSPELINFSEPTWHGLIRRLVLRWFARFFAPAD